MKTICLFLMLICSSAFTLDDNEKTWLRTQQATPLELDTGSRIVIVCTAEKGCVPVIIYK
jgi:hypothetical protein